MANLISTIVTIILILIVWFVIDTKKEKQVRIALVISGAIVIAHHLFIFNV